MQDKLWPLWEMRVDKSRAHMRVVDAYLRPILEEALVKKARRERGGKARLVEAADEIEDGETLLDHLVKYTSGEWLCLASCCLVSELDVDRFDCAA